MQSFRCAIYTSDGWYLSAVNGGGLPTPNAGVAPVALHTDSRTASAWETFRVIIGGDVSGIFNGMPFALQTSNGNYITATNGGGIGGPNDASSPVHTDARTPETWETFTFDLDDSTNPPTARIQTNNKNYLTAVNGGGVVGSDMPIQSSVKTIGIWEQFILIARGS